MKHNSASFMAPKLGRPAHFWLVLLLLFLVLCARQVMGASQPLPTPRITVKTLISNGQTPGSTVQLGVSALDASSYHFQWYYEQTNALTGATNSTLTLTNFQITSAVSYSVIISPILAITNVNVPAISGFNPGAAPVGTNVVISGTNFSAVASNNIVYFGAVRAKVLGANPTSLIVGVPVGATLAPITVTVNGLTAYANHQFMPTYAGNGSGISTSSFGSRQDLPAGSTGFKVLIADIDGDGKADLVVANYLDNTISIFRNISSNGVPLTAASFAPRVDLATPPGPFLSTVADVDGDGKLDIIVADSGTNLVSVYQNHCTPGNISTNLFAEVDFIAGNGPQAVEVRDMDGDGKPDILVANAGDGTLSVLRNTGVTGSLTMSSFAPKVDFTTGAGCHAVLAGDLDGDGQPDVVTANMSGNTLSVLRNLSTPGNLVFAPQVLLNTQQQPVQIALGDLTGDGRLDVLTTSYLPQTLSVFHNLGTLGSLTTNSFAPRIDYSLDGRGHTIALGDLEGEGKLDVADVTEINSWLNIFSNASTPGNFTNTSLAGPVEFSTGINPWGVSIGDLDGDGRPDIVFCNVNDKTVSIYQNQVPFAGTAPVITVQPTNQTANVGGTATFRVTAVGTGVLGYQWSVNNTVFSNSTGAALTLTNVQLSQSGNVYRVRVSDNYGSVTSSNAVLTVNSISGSCTPPPAGLVGWWPGEGNADVVIGTNNGFLSSSGAGYASGKVGLGFRFDGTNGYVEVPYSTALEPSNLTVEAWVWLDPNINATNAVAEQIVFKQNTWSAWFEGYSLSKQPIQNPDGSYSNRFQFVVSRSGDQVVINSVTIAQRGVWYHVAATYDGNRSTLYVNGVAEASTVAGFALDYGPEPVYFGTTGTWVPYLNMFGGIIDEPSIYNRALAADEIAAIYNAGSAGKCGNAGAAPVITTQPANQTVKAGGTATFSVTASGTAPLNYQWISNNTNIIHATNASLVLANVQANQSGSVFWVRVSNGGGSTLSSNVLLTVTPSVSSCTPPPAGLVGWWKGDGNTVDSVAGNNGVFVNPQYTNGVVGQAFTFDPNSLPYGTYTGVQIPDQPAYELTNSLTIEGWIRPRGDGYVILWRGDHRPGLDPYNFSMEANNTLVFQICQADGTGAMIQTTANYYQWTHVTATLDGSTGAMSIYTNGVLAVQTNTSARPFGRLDPTQSPGVGIGNVNDGGNNFPFVGDIDEISLYNRALSAGEIAAIYSAGSLGKCLAPALPLITSQPASQTVNAGGAAAFSVTAAGTVPLSYQWIINNSNFSKGTNATLVLTNLQLSQSGSVLRVQVSNAAGSVLSSNAVLTVNAPSGSCTPPPPGLIGWWPGEGNANDAIGTNNGSLSSSGAGYAPGKVGLGFRFDGTNGYVEVPNSTTLEPSNLTLEAWVWLDPNINTNPATEHNEHIIFKQNTWTAWFEGYSLLKAMIQNSDGSYSRHFQFVVSRSGDQVAINSITVVQRGVWYHVAATYDGNRAMLYVNGAPEVSAIAGFPLDYGTEPVYFGTTGTWAPYLDMLAGIIDEPSIYNRALATNEIAAIYHAGSSGKCGDSTTAPVITTQPASQTVNVGGTATFRVTATGPAPLSYEWTDNNAILPNGNSATLVLTKVQLRRNGSVLRVHVSNAFGSTISSNAVLTVVSRPAGPINPAPMPTLRNKMSGKTLQFSWSRASSNYVLEFSPTLWPAKWVTVSQSPSVDGDQNSVAIPVSASTNGFYRLRFVGP